jgi:YtcA family
MSCAYASLTLCKSRYAIRDLYNRACLERRRFGPTFNETATTLSRQIVKTMKTSRTVAKFIAGGFVLLLLLFVASQFSSYHSLTVDVFGSYFPAWMVCILSGLTLTLIAHRIVQVRKLKSDLGPLPLIYSCLMIVFTFATWILFYKN